VAQFAIPEYPIPAKRLLRVYSFDPQTANTFDRTVPGIVTIAVGWESLRAGPLGSRLRVVDFDGARKKFYEPVDLDDPHVAAQGGLAPDESDPRFHQQMVYAVAARTLEVFDAALGRRVRVPGRPLTLVPHAFVGNNAYYDPALRTVLFGYFKAGADAGPNLPGQWVFTCLSHDVIVHEVTHAVIDGLRHGFLNATNPDVPAFHEAIADITAIFLHFTLPGVVASVVAATRADLTDSTPLVELAQQFGYATGRRSALRTAIDEPNTERYHLTTEPHERGAILVSAVFDAFVQVYQRRIADLLRLATGGTGTLPAGSLPPDLVNRTAGEAIRTSRQILTMCLRGLDYLPPADATFADFLQAVVTADRELFPSDRDGLRAAMIDGFRRRGIYPVGVASLADTAVALRPVGLAEPRIFSEVLSAQLTLDTLALDARIVDDDNPGHDQSSGKPAKRAKDSIGERRYVLKRQLEEALAGNPESVRILGFCADTEADPVRHADQWPVTTFRYDEEGAPHVAFVYQLTQRVRAEEIGLDRAKLLGSLLDHAVVRATTVVVDHRGTIRYVIARPYPGPGLAPSYAAIAERRLGFLLNWTVSLDHDDAMAPFAVSGKPQNSLRIEFAGLHEDQP
jgi:hypothetical protein